jgi:hypothetical protein
MFPLASIAND